VPSVQNFARVHLAGVGLDAAALARKRKADAHYGAMWPRMRELLARGLVAEKAADVLTKEGYRGFKGGGPVTGKTVRETVARFQGGAAVGSPPIIPGDDGKSAQVRGLDGNYRVKALKTKAQRDVVEALVKAGVDGLSYTQLLAVCGDAKGVLKRLMEDPDWKAIIYPPENGIGWRFGPPR
jgi:hypothetical protein